MKIGKYCFDITEFELKPWYRADFEFEDEREEKGVAYVYRGWMWVVVSEIVRFG